MSRQVSRSTLASAEPVCNDRPRCGRDGRRGQGQHHSSRSRAPATPRQCPRVAGRERVSITGCVYRPKPGPTAPLAAARAAAAPGRGGSSGDSGSSGRSGGGTCRHQRDRWRERGRNGASGAAGPVPRHGWNRRRGHERNRWRGYGRDRSVSTGGMGGISPDSGTDAEAGFGAAGGSGGTACQSDRRRRRKYGSPGGPGLAVDNSASMAIETVGGTENLNAFAQQISAAGWTSVCVLLAGSPDVLRTSCSPGVCVPAPLGSGNLPERQPVPWAFPPSTAIVGSNDGARVLVERFPEYRSVLRAPRRSI